MLWIMSGPKCVYLCECVCDTEVKSVDKDNKQGNICECSSSVYMHASVCVCPC